MKILLSRVLLVALAQLPAVVYADYAESSIEARAEGQASAVGYDSVAAALAALSAKPGITQRINKNGWTEIEDHETNVLWSFVPKDHPAYPAVVKRTVTGRGLATQIDMTGLCEAERAACEKLMRQLQKQNQVAKDKFFRLPPRGGGTKADVTPIGSLLSAVQ